MARGDITQSPGHGKKIATFPFDVTQEFDGKMVTKKVNIEVYMRSKYGSSEGADKPVTACQFYLRSEGFEEGGAPTSMPVCKPCAGGWTSTTRSSGSAGCWSRSTLSESMKEWGPEPS